MGNQLPKSITQQTKRVNRVVALTCSQCVCKSFGADLNINIYTSTGSYTCIQIHPWILIQSHIQNVCIHLSIPSNWFCEVRMYVYIPKYRCLCVCFIHPRRAHVNVSYIRDHVSEVLFCMFARMYINNLSTHADVRTACTVNARKKNTSGDSVGEYCVLLELQLALVMCVVNPRVVICEKLPHAPKWSHVAIYLPGCFVVNTREHPQCSLV